MRELICALLLATAPVTGADPALPDCTGGAVIGPGVAHTEVKAVPGGVYDLSVWVGSNRPGPGTAAGLLFLDRTGTQVGRTYASWPRELKPKRYNSYGMVAPEQAATARFFAATTAEIHWDCVLLRVSAYDVTLTHGDGTLLVTVTNTGSEPLTNLRLDLPVCADLDRTPFDLKGQVTRTCTGVGPATATVSGALYWNGALPDRSASLSVFGGGFDSGLDGVFDDGLGGLFVRNQPQHTGGRQLQDR